jgi:hypothetical protein
MGEREKKKRKINQTMDMTGCVSFDWFFYDGKRIVEKRKGEESR